MFGIEGSSDFKQSAVTFCFNFSPHSSIRTWPRYTKHQHDFKNKVWRFLGKYIRQILTDGTISRVFRKRDNNSSGPGVKKNRVPKIERPSTHRTLCYTVWYATVLLSRSRFYTVYVYHGRRTLCHEGLSMLSWVIPCAGQFF